ncbi:hypothetical protein PSACC_02643 [Paramicrosporidium saccamoebae]|uniref:DUF6818 domain-containing protein n=1 Tax=Paramicrosporidium saccamoebae TaxID=1246581 RepID=A0A2H9TIJ0_9FUNG|nr:hypothetical protein PSACC_02643 [Paramicrosporidium saccamoebae]
MGVVLLDIVEKIRPLQRQRWEEVAVAYNDQIAGKDWCPRDADALKRRFMVLAYAKKPSGRTLLADLTELAEEWREFMDRAMAIHHSILEEAGAAVNIGMGGGLVRSADTDGMLLLTENEAELVHAASQVPMTGFDEDYLSRLSSGSMLITPVRTGKRGRPPGSTTGSAAKRMAQQVEHVAYLSRVVGEMQKQLRETREALATVVETQTNQSAVLAVLQQQLHQQEPIPLLTKKMPIRTLHEESNDSFQQMLA